MLPAHWHRNIFLFGLIGLASGMLFGTVPTSIPQIILAANWLLEKDYNYKFQQLKSNKIFWVLACLYILHLVGMFNTQDTQHGLDDLRNKIPLLTLPALLLSTKPLSQKEFRLLFSFFFLSVLVSSFCCYAVYAGYTKKVILDVRKASVFMSHIRFSLFIAFSVIGIIYVYFKEEKKGVKCLCILAAVWLMFFMYQLEMATGLLFLLLVGPILIISFSLKKLPRKITIGLIVILVLSGLIIFNQALSSLNMFDKSSSNKANILLEKTKNENYYFQDTSYKIAENGNLITVNVNYGELKKEWNLKSQLSFDGSDKKGNKLYFTLLRYMASKGLTKDSLGILSLSKEDVVRIENGTPNYKYNVNSGLISKWREIVWEYTKYKHGENPSGHTLTMRLEFWKNACYIIQKRPVFGVGTGDIQGSFDKMYIFTNSKLDPLWRLRCHNQYLAITVAFGFVGLFIFLFYLFYPAILLRKKLHYLYWPFFLIALLSFMTEDTLETQSGVTFFIFFQTLFLWQASFLCLQSSKNKFEVDKT
ncbi:MAG: O-antigen ligase family protein [Burkholderiales bacterium]|nr:O-antigen ligase family protein [Bacteroidia bacterium]